MTPELSRRQALGAAGAATVGLLLRAHGAQAASLTPSRTIGPYFVDEKLNRSDIRGGVAGLPLQLAFTLLDGGAPVSGAQVDVWHAAPGGTYSDEAAEGTSGQTYLRGYQVSDAAGKVAFTTVYPGWYSGRTVHIHVRVRSGSLDFVTQVFFDDATTDAVYAHAPYSARGARDTRNAADRIYGSDGARLQLALTGDATAGFTGAFAFHLSGAAAAELVSTRFKSRTLTVRFRTDAAETVELRLLRGTRTLVHRSFRYATAGTYSVRVALPATVAAGRATLELSAGGVTASKVVYVPRR